MMQMTLTPHGLMLVLVALRGGHVFETLHQSFDFRISRFFEKSLMSLVGDPTKR